MLLTRLCLDKINQFGYAAPYGGIVINLDGLVIAGHNGQWYAAGRIVAQQADIRKNRGTGRNIQERRRVGRQPCRTVEQYDLVSATVTYNGRASFVSVSTLGVGRNRLLGDCGNLDGTHCTGNRG